VHQNIHHIRLIYDEQCPLCDAYCRRVRIRESVGELQLVDARADQAALAEVTQRGFDIDQGIVLQVNDVWYYGPDAIHALCLMSGSTGIFNRINYWLFSSPVRARLFYPPLRACRNLVLRVLGVTRINNLSLPNNERF
jgi:predicted DCC family thiol-disulfide oxidoreductase YuxK